jgi:hypothetical protein
MLVSLAFALAAAAPAIVPPQPALTEAITARDAELFDLSSTGFRMNTFAKPAIGKHIWVNLPGLQPLEAIVRRADGNNYGCEFVHPLHPSVAKHLQVKLR